MQRIQHILFLIRLNLLPSQRIARRSIGCFESDNVLASNAIDAAVEHRLDAFALADFAPEIDGQRLFERAIENGIGGGIYKIRNQDRIFFGQRVPTLEKYKANSGSDDRDKQSGDEPPRKLARGRGYLVDAGAPGRRTG